VKFALNSLLLDARLDELASLLTEGDQIGGIEGEPGWMLERRDVGNNMPGYAAWPAGAHFRAFVDPDFFEMAHPEFYMSRDKFQRYVTTALGAYLRVNPNATEVVASVSRKFGNE
jgi:hypothetical protein